MQIQHKQSGSKGMFYIEVEGRILAEMVYTMAGNDRMIIEHTEVDDELRGQNIGGQLVHHAVEYARLLKIKILPVCPFASSVFKKKLEYNDVLFQPK